ncbi:hypothetical protein [Tenacibaculum soleae]|uniref:hypothetical protein n=1 Tax=Tenacibaculum soleae TaxID=447689 RepID=UPI003AB2E733
MIYKLTKILGGFPIPFLFTILGARNTQQIIYKIVVLNVTETLEIIGKEIKKLIIGFENELESAEKTIEKINKISSNRIDEYSLRNYWRKTDLEDFVEVLSMPQIEKWKEIDDVHADKLITEYKNNLTNDALMNRNATALEKRYKKSNGTLSNWIFYENITDNKKIIELLKKDTTIKL